MKPIIPPKYDIGIVIKNCSNELLEMLEPWCTTIYTDAEFTKYITIEQARSSFNLKERCLSIHSDITNNIEVRMDGNRLNNTDIQYIHSLPEILKDSGELGTFELGNLEISINSLENYEQNLIINKEKKDVKN
jgi:hypothetical protein